MRVSSAFASSFRYTAALLLVALALSPRPASATPVPVSGTLSNPLGSGWNAVLSGGFIPQFVIQPTNSHTFRITLSDGSVTSFEAAATTDNSISSILPVYLSFPEIAGTAASLVALRSNLTPYSTTDFSDNLAITVGDITIYDLNDPNLAPINPPFFRFTIGGAQFTLAQGTSSPGSPIPLVVIPESGTGLLVFAGLLGLAGWRGGRA
jgi:hypothetical protein